MENNLKVGDYIRGFSYENVKLQKEHLRSFYYTVHMDRLIGKIGKVTELRGDEVIVWFAGKGYFSYPIELTIAEIPTDNYQVNRECFRELGKECTNGGLGYKLIQYPFDMFININNLEKEYYLSIYIHEKDIKYEKWINVYCRISEEEKNNYGWLHTYEDFEIICKRPDIESILFWVANKEGEIFNKKMNITVVYAKMDNGTAAYFQEATSDSKPNKPIKQTI